MNTEIQPFEFEHNQVRALADGDEVMFVASDIAKILGYRDAANLTRTLDADEKGTHEVSTPRSGMQTMTVLTESGLYRAILNREIAYVKEPESRAFVKRFQRWVTHEVLPTIRKHGIYATETTIDQILADPDFGIRLLTDLKKERAKRIEAENHVKELAPKAKALEDFTNVPETLLVRDAAKLLSNAGTPIGEKELREWLSQHGWTYRHAGTWCAASERVKAGHLVMVASRAHGQHKDGSIFAFAPTVKITRKGLVLLHTRLGETRLNETLETTTH
nr:MAG: antirepressor protein KilAC domain protein [Bacteriophage sp.]